MSPTLVIAAGSFVGRAVMAELARQGRESVGASRAECDVTDAGRVDAKIEQVRPGAIVSCAGVTDGADPAPYYATHVGGTLNVLASVRRHVPVKFQPLTPFT